MRTGFPPRIARSLIPTKVADTLGNAHSRYESGTQRVFEDGGTGRTVFCQQPDSADAFPPDERGHCSHRVTPDRPGSARAVTSPIPRALMRELDIPPAYLVLLATHNHQAPIQLIRENFDKSRMAGLMK